MTRADDRRIPGRLLLWIARRVCAEPALTHVVYPAVADLQHEVAAAAGSRARRAAIYCRAYAALLSVLTIVPFTPGLSLGGHPDMPPPRGSGGGFLLLLALLLLAATWPFFGAFATGALLAGVLMAALLRSWHTRHPSAVARRERPQDARFPEINLSAIPVGGDVGGLIFTGGSIAILILGMPGLRWFLVGAMACAMVVAAGLYGWRQAHPYSPHEGSIVR